MMPALPAPEAAQQTGGAVLRPRAVSAPTAGQPSVFVQEKQTKEEEVEDKPGVPSFTPVSPPSSKGTGRLDLLAMAMTSMAERDELFLTAPQQAQPRA